MSHVVTRNLTTLDFFKLAALILMVVDHIGFYFLPERTGLQAVGPGDPYLWWRVFGRWCVPIWFFLVGYARSRDVSAPMWIGGIILILANMLTGMFVFPLNNLFSILLIRLVLDRLARFTFSGWENLFLVNLLILVLYPPTMMLTEYGAIALVPAFYGYLVRQSRDVTALEQPALLHRSYFLVGYFIFTALALIGSQVMVFNHFDLDQMIVMSAGIIGVLYLLGRVSYREYPILTARLPDWGVWVIQLAGRRTMEFYVIHLTMFKLIALIFGIGMPIYGWLDWDWTAVEAMQHLVSFGP